MRTQGLIVEPATAVSIPGSEGPLAAAQQQLLRIADRLRLTPAARDLLSVCQREYHVSIPIQMDDGSTRVFRGYRMPHNEARGPGKGGIKSSMRDAAYLIAVDRAAAACRQRGWV